MGKRRAESIGSRFLAKAAVVVIVTAALPAWAALGGDVASVQADQIHMQGSRQIKATATYTVHEIQAATGTVVREYASNEGKIFAVAWRGPWPSDMRQLLGTYFEQYAQAAKAQSGSHVGRRPLLIELPGLTVQLSGYSRSLAGRAYVPEMLPSGVRAEDIR